MKTIGYLLFFLIFVPMSAGAQSSEMILRKIKSDLSRSVQEFSCTSSTNDDKSAKTAIGWITNVILEQENEISMLDGQQKVKVSYYDQDFEANLVVHMDDEMKTVKSFEGTYNEYVSVYVNIGTMTVPKIIIRKDSRPLLQVSCEK